MNEEYAVETSECTPKMIFAGDFPTLMDCGTAAEDIPQWTPIIITETGIAVASVTKISDIVGISAEVAAAGDPIVYYITGEFFNSAINLPKDLTIEAIKPVLRKLSIFLRED